MTSNFQKSDKHKRTASQDSNLSRQNANSVVPAAGRRQRRTRIPERPNYHLNLWSIMKNCIGKELTKIPMPVSCSPGILFSDL